MRTEKVLMSALHIVLLFLVLAIGIFCLFLGSIPALKSLAIDTITDSPHFFIKIGLMIIAFAFLLGFVLYLINKKQYFKVVMNSHSCNISAHLIREYIEKYWRREYPKEKIKTEVILKKSQNIEIIARLPFIKKIDADVFFEKTEKEIAKLLFDKFQYQKKFILTLNF